MAKQKVQNSKRAYKSVTILAIICGGIIIALVGFVGYVYHSFASDSTDWMPTTAKFQMHDKEKIKTSGIEARKNIEKQFITLGYDSKLADKKSSVDLCYRTTRDSGFSTIGYTKTCNFRETMIFTSSDAFTSVINDKIASTEALTKYEINPSDEPPCKSLFFDGMNNNIKVDIAVCPRKNDLPNYLSYNVAFSNERYQDDSYEIRGPLDSEVGIETKDLQVNYHINSASLYNFNNSIRNYADSSNGSVIIVGVTNRYYSDDVE